MAGVKTYVRYYTTATAKIFFPENDVGCRYCSLFETYSRKQCRATGEYISDERGVGYMCPLQFDEEEMKKNYEKFAKETKK